MKKYLSVFALSARRTLPRLLIIWAVMAAAETALFAMALKNAEETAADGSMPLLQDVVASSHMAWILGAAFLLTMAVLCNVLGKKAAGLSAYTIRRLPVSEQAFYWIQALYNLCALLTLLGAQIAAILAMVSIYDKAAAAANASQHLVFLGFYQSPVLHGLLPLADTLYHIENLLILLALSLSAARFAKMQSRGVLDGAAPTAVILTCLAFFGRSTEYGDMMHILLVFVAAAGVVSAYTISKGGTLDDEASYISASAEEAETAVQL